MYLPLWFLAFVVFAQSAKEPQASRYDVQEAYDVYAAALALDHVKGELLIADTTAPFNECLDSRSDKLADAAINDYKDNNKVRWQLQRQFRLKRSYRLLSNDEIKHLQRVDPQGGFSWRLPRGVEIIHFSAVGFSTDKTVAFVEIAVVCGGLCGHGSLFFLQKRNEKWKEYPLPWITNPDGTFQGPVTCSWNY